jgi:hypothetical protein
VWAWLDRHRLDPWQRQAQRMRAALQRLGIDAAAHDTPRELAARVRDRLAGAGEPLALQLETLERQRYSLQALTTPDRAFARRFARQASRLRRPV